MIDENLMRTDLSPAERSKAVAERKSIYEDLHPETKHRTNQHERSRQIGDSSAERFTAETAKAVGRPERSIELDASRGEKIAAPVLAFVAGTALDRSGS